MSERKIICARSVHLHWKTPADCNRFDVSLNVEKSHPGSFFMAVGWSQGYFGIQDLGGDHHGLICSVWDGNDTDPNLVQQAKALKCADGATVRRFGGEGCGLQCIMPFKIRNNLRFSVCAEVLTAEWTRYSAWVFYDGGHRLRLVDYLSRMEGRLLNGLYSFVEDFRRDTESAHHSRRAVFHYPTCVYRGGADDVKGAKFTIASPDFEGDNYDARRYGKSGIELSTGGRIENTCTPGTFIPVCDHALVENP